ncbi:TPA: replication protein [Escherichia coli]|nr:replication protein [Escherichia coli]HCM0242120.1 replication protein [Escherichia coli]
MTNTAKILNFGRGNFTGQERNVADLDDGYARLSNMLLEAYSGADLTKRQFKVLLAILRKTYGWNKPMDRITDSQLSEITKLPVKRCNEAKLELVRMNIIKQQGGMFGPNKNISEWCIPQNEGKSPKTRDKTSLKLGDCYPSKQGDTKDTITKEKRKDYSSENSGESSDQPGNDLSVVKPDAAIQSGSKWGTAEDLTAAEWMFDMVKTIAPSARKPNFAGWANDIRLMRERDGRNHRDMCVLFRWACQDNFWSGNVLSPAKLRDKWTQLEINRNKQQAVVTASKPKLDLTNTDWIYGVDL